VPRTSLCWALDRVFTNSAHRDPLEPTIDEGRTALFELAAAGDLALAEQTCGPHREGLTAVAGRRELPTDLNPTEGDLM
jgi:hypothetical protein